MKFGFRTPSLKKRFAARTSLKRYIRHSMGLKMPRGFGMITNPKKAIYNKIYNRTTFSIDSLLKGKTPKTKSTTKENIANIILIFPMILFCIGLTIRCKELTKKPDPYRVYTNKSEANNMVKN